MCVHFSWLAPEMSSILEREREVERERVLKRRQVHRQEEPFDPKSLR